MIDQSNILSTEMLLQRYKILNSLPMEKEEIANIAEMMYNRMLDKEEEAIVKLRQVINFATNNECESTIFDAYMLLMSGV